MGLFEKLIEGLKKTRGGAKFEELFDPRRKINDDFYDELEETLIIADVGVNTTLKIMQKLRSEVKTRKISNAEQAKPVLKQIIADTMRPDAAFLEGNSPAVILIVGVNGVGKTTAIGKLANLYKSQGKKVMLAAGDTFRAAAAEQLCVWGERTGVPVVKHGEGADPAAVVFDAISSAKAKKIDLLLCDTAGRLHNKKNLMEELKKIGRIISRDYSESACEVLLVLDATTGQNAIMQAKMFAETVDLTGIILTKLDGTAKGGVVIAVKDELNVPVRFIGIGEGMDDIQPFNPDDFAAALL